MIDKKMIRNTKKPKSMADLPYWRLIWMQFKKHKVAQVGLAILGIIYLGMIFCEFIAPNDPLKRIENYYYTPPQKIHFIDEEGKFSFRPFVYDYKVTTDKETYKRSFEANTEKKYPIYLFIRGDEYKLWGVFKSDVHLFGVKEGKIIPFGTDKIGQCVFSQVAYGGRISLTIGLIGVFVITVIGVIVGGISGLLGGIVDSIIQRIIEIIRSIPMIPLWLALAAAIPATWPPVRVFIGIVLIISLLGWTTLARVIRGKFISLREEEFIMAARLSGTSQSKIILKHMIPNFMGYVLVDITITIPAMILGETALSFLGLGLHPPTISWGVLLSKAQGLQTVTFYPWLLIPGAFVVISVIAFNIVGDGLRDAFDPYSVTGR